MKETQQAMGYNGMCGVFFMSFYYAPDVEGVRANIGVPVGRGTSAAKKQGTDRYRYKEI